MQSNPAANEVSDAEGTAEIRAWLRRLWEEVLPVADVDTDAHFLDLGGDSLLAARICAAAAEEGLRPRPILSDLFAFPTVCRLAAELERRRAGAGAQRRDHVVPLRTQGERNPLFCVHPVNGEVGFMQPLFEAARLRRPVYGIRAPGLWGERPPFRTLQGMAARNLELVRRTQPEGPYFLSGYCFGGDVAIEMAAQLRAAGEAVAFVGVLDPAVADPEVPRMSDAQLRAVRMAEHVETCEGVGRPVDHLDLSDPGNLPALVEALQVAGRLEEDEGVAEFEARMNVWVTNNRALARYRRPELDIVVDLFLASGHTHPDAGPWAFPGVCETHRFSGHHDFLFASAELAALLGQVVERRADGYGDRV